MSSDKVYLLDPFKFEIKEIRNWFNSYEEVYYDGMKVFTISSYRLSEIIGSARSQRKWIVKKSGEYEISDKSLPGYIIEEEKKRRRVY